MKLIPALHYSTLLAERRRMETKICRYLNCESHIYLGVPRNTNAKA